MRIVTRFQLAVSTALVLLFAPVLVSADRDTISSTTLSKYYTDARDVVENLDDYQALWIKVHGCVWSECAVDNNDDDGEGRDGDEQWYLARTQDFCANVAFSLYGIPKNHVSLMTCSRGNFINSFFTYGGADTLLEALGKKPSIHYNSAYTNGYYNSNYDNGYNISNADCVVDDTYYMSSTMGCSANGKFAIAEFEGEYCHGTDFYDIIDPLRKYNRQMGHIGCQRIWAKNFGSADVATALLGNSWSCDLNLYPNGCPDPYGKKASYDYALRAVAYGQSPTWAIANMKLKTPFRILSWLLLLGGMCLMVFGYHIQSRERVATLGGGIKGFFRVVSEDIHGYRKHLARKRRAAKTAAQEARAARKLERKKKKKKKRKSRSGSRRRRSRGNGDRDIELAPTGSSEFTGTYDSPVSSML